MVRGMEEEVEEGVVQWERRGFVFVETGVCGPDGGGRGCRRNPVKVHVLTDPLLRGQTDPLIDRRSDRTDDPSGTNGR